MMAETEETVTGEGTEEQLMMAEREETETGEGTEEQ